MDSIACTLLQEPKRTGPNDPTSNALGLLAGSLGRAFAATGMEQGAGQAETAQGMCSAVPLI